MNNTDIINDIRKNMQAPTTIPQFTGSISSISPNGSIGLITTRVPFSQTIQGMNGDQQVNSDKSENVKEIMKGLGGKNIMMFNANEYNQKK